MKKCKRLFGSSRDEEKAMALGLVIFVFFIFLSVCLAMGIVCWLFDLSIPKI